MRGIIEFQDTRKGINRRQTWADWKDAAQRILTELEGRDWREEFADHAHQRWQHWMIYMFSQCRQNDDGSMTIPVELVERWYRQMETDYEDLPEGEKESDRREADNIMTVLTVG
jgi:hypothetical protein